MAAGCPVVAASSGGVPDIVASGVNGYLFDPEEEDFGDRCYSTPPRTATRTGNYTQNASRTLGMVSSHTPAPTLLSSSASCEQGEWEKAMLILPSVTPCPFCFWPLVATERIFANSQLLFRTFQLFPEIPNLLVRFWRELPSCF